MQKLLTVPNFPLPDFSFCILGPHLRIDDPRHGVGGHMAKIDAFFNLMMEVGASDLHLASGSQPIVRVRGELERIAHDPLDNDALKTMLYEITPEYKVKVFEETGDVDFGYEIT